MTEALLVTRSGAVETWTLNRSAKRNPISDPEMIEALVSSCDRVNADRQVRAVILTGAGDVFSAGGDVKAMRARSGMFGGSPHQVMNGYRSGIQEIPLAFHRCEVPIIAAVNGPAVGAGCDLAAMCDIRVAAESAWFAESFVKLGIIPGDGGAWLLPRIVGHARAVEMALTGDRVPARQALEWGLVNRVVPGTDLMDAADDYARRIAANPPHAVRMTKRLLREADQSSLSSILELSASFQAISHHTSDHVEALAALLDKRDAAFTGE